MLLTNINNSVSFESFGNRLEELKAFRRKCEIWQLTMEATNADDDPGISAFYKRTDNAMFFRLIGGTDGKPYNDTSVIVTMIDDGGIMDKQWIWTDKTIDNSQGGTTHLKGWHLE